MTEVRKAQVRVPCSTSNLGSGFDTLGLALNRYLVASFRPGGHTLEVEFAGTLDLLEGPPEDDFLVSVFSAEMERAGVRPLGALHLWSEVPVARGLGSSAAALVAGFELARAVLGKSSDQEGAFRQAAAREGHGDNAAPCALGGLRGVVAGSNGPRPLLLSLSDEVGFAYAAPAKGVSTAAARAALPGQVAHAVAVAQLGRMTALLRGLAEGDPKLIRVGIEDELHVPHRLPLIVHGERAMSAGYEAGAWGVTISGSGSGLLAVCSPDDAPAVAAAMREVFDAGAGDPGCVGFALSPDFEGAVHL
ncbi:MAG: homoserine kinase [Gemmatimonadota bacterium]|jgi:homoserine kinase